MRGGDPRKGEKGKARSKGEKGKGRGKGEMGKGKKGGFTGLGRDRRHVRWTDGKGMFVDGGLGGKGEKGAEAAPAASWGASSSHQERQA